MNLINMAACSPSFQAAFEAVKGGRVVRRASWTKGLGLRLLKDGRIAVYHGDVIRSPQWAGPSSSESEATDWIVEPISAVA